MKAVQLLIDSLLPADLRDPSRVYDAKSIGSLMSSIARDYPDRYEELSQKISDIGRKASYWQGETLTLSDLKPVLDKGAVFAKMDAEIAAAKKEATSPEDFEQERLKIWIRYSDDLEKLTHRAALKAGNNLAYSVMSGARGKPAQLKAMLTTPGLFSDYKGGTIPIFVRHSYGEGLRPAEYLASTFGARKAVISTKSSTAKGGDFGKISVQATAPLVVTAKDCGVYNGIELPTADPSARGRVLARDAGDLKAGTILDKSALSHLHAQKIDEVITRSVLTCQAPEGVCAKCCGQWAGKFPHIGQSVGITSAQSIGEPITQSALNEKHTAGMTSGKREFSGFDVISQFAASPETFPDRAAVAEQDGKVTKVEKAPQGGHFVFVGDEKHYVLPNYDVMVKPGDLVEAGDQLSDGLVDPGDVVRLRGLGEGRKYYTERLSRILSDSGMPADRRNVEMMARASLNHVVIDDPDGSGDYLPDDVANYSRLSTKYVPPVTAKGYKPLEAVGKYLQSPALHYTIGTRITPRIAEHLEAKFGPVIADDTEPGFHPDMSNLRTASQASDDWMAKLHTSYLRKNLSESAMRGEDTAISGNVHFAPPLAHGVGFGDHVEETGRF
jgi:DNA-directed RNA polymerase subunit beta'